MAPWFRKAAASGCGGQPEIKSSTLARFSLILNKSALKYANLQ
jgi:hypothetical protein|tara:strand:- start:163 stop:291 length:129 start_codon:yes stop_codon:yes gene_type:complete